VCCGEVSTSNKEQTAERFGQLESSNKACIVAGVFVALAWSFIFLEVLFDKQKNQPTACPSL